MKHCLFMLINLALSQFGYSQGVIAVNDYIRDYARLLEVQGKSVNNPIIFHSNQREIWQYDSIPEDSLGAWQAQLRYYKDSKEKGLKHLCFEPQNRLHL